MTLLTVPEVAARLGCSRQHVYNLIAAGRLATVDISIHGRPKLRIAPAALSAFLDRSRLPARRTAA